MRNTCHKALFILVGALFMALPLSAGVYAPNLQVGDWAYPEPWQNWIGGESRSSAVRLNVVDNDGLIQNVKFYYSTDNGLTWTLFGTDTNGHAPRITTITYIPGPLGPIPIDPALLAPGDGWSTLFPHALVPQMNMKVFFRAVALLSTGDSVITKTWRNYDPTPPDEAVVTCTYSTSDTLIVDVTDPYADIDSITIIKKEEPETFYKGIPGVSQRPNSDWHCVPAATAACLKYFEGKGDPVITGGLTDSSLVDTLGDLGGTNQHGKGTSIADMVAALIEWIKNHGGNYNVRQVGFDWFTASNELKRCQDVIMCIRWPGGGGHMVTFNSIVNTPNFDGTIRVDFMDPWTGQIEWGDLNPNTGELSGFTGAGPGGMMGDMMIVCPNSQNPFITSGGDPIGGGKGPNPIPEPVPLSDKMSWSIKVQVVDLQGNAHTYTSVVAAVSDTKSGVQGAVIPNFYIAQNSPNPFSDKTDIAFALPKKSTVTVTVYDASGAKVVTLAKGEYKAGVHKLVWDAKAAKVKPGVYFCELKTDSGYRQSVKMLIVR